MQAIRRVLPAKRSPDDESLASFFRRRVGQQAFERMLEPLMAGIYAGDAEQMSVLATFPRFVELEQQYGSVIRGKVVGFRDQQFTVLVGTSARGRVPRHPGCVV